MDGDGVGEGVARGDLNGSTGEKAGAVGEVEEGGFLVENSCDRQGRVEGAIEEGDDLGLIELAFGGGDGVAVGVGGGVA